jgi:hypothetical protein
MDPVSLTLAALLWLGSTEIASGPGKLGPWQMNESRWSYVDDATVAIDGKGAIATAWVDQARKDVLFQRLDPGGKKLGEPVNVSRSPKVFSWLPRIAFDAKGTIFILWQEIIFSGGSHGGDILFARSEDGGKSFSAPQNLSDSVAGDGKGRINRDLWHNGSLDLVAHGNTVYVAWTEYEGALWVRRSSDGGRSFSQKARLDEAKPARAPALAVHGGTVYLAWTVGDDPSADIRVARSANGKFGAPVIVERTKGYSDAPKLALDASGTLHIVYGESERGLFAGRHVRYARSADGGRSFEKPRDISGPHAGFPALGIDANGNLYVLWERFEGDTLRPRGLSLALSQDAGRTFRAARVPESAGSGWNGSLQGLLQRKLAVGAAGAIAIVNSSIKPNEGSSVWLTRGKLKGD